MENPISWAEGEGSLPRSSARSRTKTEPILLSLPLRERNTKQAAGIEDRESVWDKLQAIETGSGPKVEMVLLENLLRQSPGLEPSLADPHEIHTYQHPLAAVNAYKHRLHALRCEFVNTRLKTVELERQLAQSQARVERLENHIQFLDRTLQQMLASRAWKWAERCSRWQRSIVQGLRHLLGRSRKTQTDGEFPNS